MKGYSLIYGKKGFLYTVEAQHGRKHLEYFLKEALE